jgi:predicted RecA/RadA family phage recombinase
MDNFDFKKYLVENNLGPFTKPSVMQSDKVVDVAATLRALQSAVKAGSIVTIEDEEVFKMPMINLATFKSGGRVTLPRDPEDLAFAAGEILVDGKPLTLIYKNAPAPAPKTASKPFDSSAYTDPESIYYRGGD